MCIADQYWPNDRHTRSNSPNGPGTNGFPSLHPKAMWSNLNSPCSRPSTVYPSPTQLHLDSLESTPQASNFPINTEFSTSRSTTSVPFSPTLKRKTQSLSDISLMMSGQEVGWSVVPGHGLLELVLRLRDGSLSWLFGYGANLYRWNWPPAGRRFSKWIV